MLFLSPSQCRAARGLLDWSQPDLAKKSSMHVQTISAFEHETGTPTKTTLEKLTLVFDKEGIRFTETGVEFNENPVFIVRGNNDENTYLQLLEDAIQHLSHIKKPELLMMYTDERFSTTAINDKYREIRKRGIKMRQLIEKDNTYIIGPLNEYRCIPTKFFINRVTLIYGDRVANQTENLLKCIIRVDAMNAKLHRNTFNMLWDTLEKPEKTTATENF